MAKTLMEVSPEYEELVLDVFSQTGLENYIEVKVFAMAKVGKDVIKVQKANELAEKAWESEDIIVISIAEPIFDLVDEQTRRIWVENALSQVAYDTEKDKLLLGKEPSINLTLGMYDKYKDIIVQKLQLAALSIQQYKDAEKQRKAEEKAAKKNKKKFD